MYKPLKDYKWIFYDGKEGRCEVDLVRSVLPDGFWEDQVYVHCNVHDNTFKSLRKAKEVFKEVREWAESMGYEHVYTFTQNVRWCKILDDSFNHLATVPHLGETYEVLEW